MSLATITSTYTTLMIFTAALSLIVIMAIWWRRLVPASRAMILVFAAVALWSFFAALEASAVAQDSKILWSKLSYLGICAAGPALLMFTLEYTHQARRLTQQVLLSIWIIPILTISLAATNEWHNLLWSGFAPGPEGSNQLVYLRGPWFYINVAFIYAIVASSTIILARYYFVGPKLMRRQLGPILFAAIFPWVTSVMYVTGLTPFPGYDITPLGFFGSAILMAWSVLGNQLFDLVPVAREALIENLADGVFVLDSQSRVVDMNPAAQLLTGKEAIDILGYPAEIAFVEYPDLLTCLDGYGAGQIEINMLNGRRVVEARVSALIENKNRPNGHLIILTDVTPRKQAEQALKQVNQRLQTQLDEIAHLQTRLREQAIRDPLTGLFNRRYLEESLELEIHRSRRSQLPICLAIADIDKFKRINDSYGHKAGDLMLNAIADYLRNHTRSGDIVCRYGGEEFIVVMPGARLDIGQQRAEQWRIEIGNLRIPYENAMLQANISFGLAEMPRHGEESDELIRAADKALYHAKHQGGNLVATVDQMKG